MTTPRTHAPIYLPRWLVHDLERLAAECREQGHVTSAAELVEEMVCALMAEWRANAGRSR
jgi:hypothetical protein